MADQKISLGRIVHYHGQPDEEPGPYAALVTAVHSPTCVNLTVFMRDQELHRRAVEQGDGRGFWFWPPRV